MSILSPPPILISCQRDVDIELIEQDLIDATNGISQTGARPDTFPAILLKKCKHALVNPLCWILRKSLDVDELSVPSFEKHANITPIHKGGCRAVVKRLL